MAYCQRCGEYCQDHYTYCKRCYFELGQPFGKAIEDLTNVENVGALYMEDITIVYHVPRKRVSLINQIIKIIKRESMDFSPVIYWKERRE
jgi:hypothetical protein|nr:MAG TPA: 50S ribosomal protein L2 [Bacteriophage sp.]